MANNDNNKVLFGFSDLYIGTYEVDSDGDVTMGSPYHQPGAVGFSPELGSDKQIFWADNMAYYVSYTDGNYSGDLEVAKFDDDFKESFLGYVRTADGGLGKVLNATKPNVYLMFAIQGDQEARKVIFYNVSMGEINRSYTTGEETKTPVTETLPVTIAGDGATGLVFATYKPTDAGYDTLFTNPPAPELGSE